MDITFIVVKTQFTALHRYPNAPEKVKFLRHSHRHIFNVEVEIEVFDDDRELEFFLVKENIDMFIEQNFNNKDLVSASCEMLAKEIKEYVRRCYWLPVELHPTRSFRKVNVKVFEDNENGCYVKEV